MKRKISRIISGFAVDFLLIEDARVDDAIKVLVIFHLDVALSFRG